MKPAAARERVRLSDDLPARLLDLRFDRLELSGVDHHQRISGPDGRVLCEAPAQAAILEARVVRSVILKLPAEDLLVELLGPAHVGRAEFDVIDPPVMIGLRHRASFSVERDVPGECRLGHVVSLSCVESHNSWLEGDNLRVRRRLCGATKIPGGYGPCCPLRAPRCTRSFAPARLPRNACPGLGRACNNTLGPYWTSRTARGLLRLPGRSRHLTPPCRTCSCRAPDDRCGSARRPSKRGATGSGGL